MQEIAELLESTADGAFAVNSSLEIVYWNQAAQDILGFNQDSTLGRHCYQVLQGLDEGSHPFCKAYCRVLEAMSKREPVASYDMRSLTSWGDRQWLNMSVVYQQGAENEDGLIIHLFRDRRQNTDFEALFSRALAAALNGNSLPAEVSASNEARSLFEALTSREREVLALLVEGCSTREIAKQLVISANTVRNHVQHILQKLHVHSRTEAVAVTIRHGRIP